MEPTPQTLHTTKPSWTAILVCAALFALAHTQAPLYYSNQHQYFLHGLAEAGRGQLSQDWLAGTRDPTPVFSALVSATARVLPDFAFQVFYFAQLMGYFASLSALATTLFPRLTGPAWWIFAATLIGIHSGAARLLSVKLCGVDYPWYFQSGVAGQYALGPGLQPSAFGMLLIASLAAFVQGRHWLAVALLCLAATVHTTYLLTAGLLTASYMLVLARQGHGRQALLLGAAALAAVTPVLVYNLLTFPPSSPEEFQRAQKILAEFRIPHHAVVRKWLDSIALAQVAWMGLGVLAARGSAAFVPLAVLLVAGAALTLVQAGTENPTLALIFPWRASVVLVPVATALLLARLSLAWNPRPAWSWASTGLLAGTAAAGVAIMAWGLAYQVNEQELALLQHIRDNNKPGEVYLIPVTVPNLRDGPRGSISASFRPAPRPGAVNLIAVDLQRFRLFTGAPIYIDFKSIPYQDVEVLQWHDRLHFAEQLYREKSWARPEHRKRLREAGVTHIVTPSQDRLPADVAELVYSDDFYRLYRLR